MFINEGEYLCMEGDKASTLYIVKSGSLVATNRSDESQKTTFGPGSIVDEFSLLESAPREWTLQAEEPSEVLVVEQDTFQEALSQKPNWLKSIITFLGARNHQAQENKKKNDLVQALPSMLFLLASHITKTETDSMPLDLLHQKANDLNSTSAAEIDQLLQSLQELGVLKVQEIAGMQKKVRAESLQIIPLLYETLHYRALNQKVSPNILTMTEQMVLSTFIKIAKEKNIPMHEGICGISTETLIAEAKKSMHGLKLTSRTIDPLVQKNLLQPSNTFDIHSPIENIDFFYADFDKIMDLLELNRVFPLLDKKLVS